MLALDVRRKRGAFALDIRLDVEPGRVTVLVGESGAGKSTLLRLVAGLDAPDSGTIALDGETWFDAARRMNLAPERRAIGYVAQDYALFPHLSVRENVAFGPRAAGIPGPIARGRADTQLEALGIHDLAGRKPGALSGGQQQRVALARALVLEPRVLLLDEPLSALDVRTRASVRGELKRLLARLPCPTLFVTHAPAEALIFGDRIAVLEQGALTQHGTREEFVHHPRTHYVAEFLGVNLFSGEIVGPAFDGLVEARVDGRAFALPDPGRAGRVQFVVHPHDVTLALGEPAGSARNIVRGVIEEVVPEPPRGDNVRVRLAGRPPLTAQVTRASAQALGLAAGRVVWASFKATGIEVLPD
jgi:molybdate transport system ATP-binding protein